MHESPIKCSPLLVMLASPLTYAVRPWSVHCKGALLHNYPHFGDMKHNYFLKALKLWKNVKEKYPNKDTKNVKTEQFKFL